MRIRLTSSDGAPVNLSGLAIEGADGVSGGISLTYHDGLIETDPISTGPYIMTLHLTHHSQTEYRLEIDHRDDLMLDLSAFTGGRLSGRAMMRDDGLFDIPLVLYSDALQLDEGIRDRVRVRLESRSMLDGRFSLGGIPPGDYVLSCGGLIPQTFCATPIPRGERGAIVLAEVLPPAVDTVRIRSGEPIDLGDAFRFAECDAEFQLEIDGAPLREVNVTALAPDSEAGVYLEGGSFFTIATSLSMETGRDGRTATRFVPSGRYLIAVDPERASGFSAGLPHDRHAVRQVVDFKSGTQTPRILFPDDPRPGVIEVSAENLWQAAREVGAMRDGFQTTVGLALSGGPNAWPMIDDLSLARRCGMHFLLSPDGAHRSPELMGGIYSAQLTVNTHWSDPGGVNEQEIVRKRMDEAEEMAKRIRSGFQHTYEVTLKPGTVCPLEVKRAD